MDYDITGDFTCKWKEIEEALYKAIGAEQNVTRLSNFLDMNYTNFKDQPLELLFDQVDRKVDSFLGRSKEVVKDAKNRYHAYLTFALLTK